MGMRRLSVEVRAWVGMLLVLQVLTSFAAVGLLARVSPAVDRILRENVASIEASEVMLALIASRPEQPIEGAERERFLDALSLIGTNVTEAEEVPIVASLDQVALEALDGEGASRARTVEALLALSEVNRASMRRADDAARRIGTAGAWAAALAGLLGAGLGVWVLDRLVRRMIVPVLQVNATLEDVRRGEFRRRCVPLVGPTEIVRLGENLNWLLDASVRPDPGTAANESLRAALLSLLDATPLPLLVVDADGIVAMNAAAYAASERDPPPAAVAEAVRRGRRPPSPWVAREIVPGRVWILAEEAED